MVFSSLKHFSLSMKKIIFFGCLILIANVLAIPVGNDEHEIMRNVHMKLSEKTSTEFWLKVALTVFLVLIGGLFAGIYEIIFYYEFNITKKNRK